jgi:metal-dependent amidase/aminoacylase/carboxypeptidase family protein
MWFSNRVISTQARDREVILLFQPAEEDGSGAQKCFQTQNLLHFNPIMFCLAQFTWISKNQIIVKNDTFTCAVNSIIIKLEGITAHAGEPEKGINPALASIITQFNTFIQADISKKIIA